LSAHPTFEADSRNDAGSDNVLRPAYVIVMLFFASLVLLLPGPNPVWAQQPSLPAVNLGDTSFLAAIAYLGWVVELIGQGVHDNKTANNTGQVVPGSTDVNSGAALTHIAWLSQGPLLIIGCQLERPA
jgi:hypothetical protein